MRRGPLEQYPVEWVLRTAGSERASGGIEFHTAQPATVHLHDGRIYYARWGTGAAEPLAVVPAPDDEDATRDHVEAVLAGLIGQAAGWYHLHPLDHHPHRGPWRWDTAGLLLAARGRNVTGAGPTASTGAAVRRGPAPAALAPAAAEADRLAALEAAEAVVAELSARIEAHRGRGRHHSPHPGAIDLPALHARPDRRRVLRAGRAGG